MRRLPLAAVGGKRIQRVLFSIRSPLAEPSEIFPLMEKAYEMGAWCFDLPATRHIESFAVLRSSTGNEHLTGFGHIEAESGVSLHGRPLHQFEHRVVSSIVKNIVPAASVKALFPFSSPGEVLTQKEIDRMTFDSPRFEQTLSLFRASEVPFLLLGGKYGDWLLGLGRIDLLRVMVAETKKRGFIPIFSAQWATFSLPKAKSLEVSAHAVPINQSGSEFDLVQACSLIKKFESPVISLNPLAAGKLLKKANEAFSFLFNDLKIYSAIAEVSSEDQVERIYEGLGDIPSLIPFRKT